MSNIINATISITGIRPLLWHAFTLDAIPLKKKERTGVAGNDPEEWKRTVLATPENQLYLEPTYIFGALRDGAKHTKVGRGSIQSKVAATLQILDEQVLINRFLPDNRDALTTDRTAPVYIDVRSVKNPTTRARNVRYRVAARAGWQATLHICWDVTIVSRSQMQAVVYDAGQLCGVGDARSIGFGRFTVESFVFSDS